jgi:hypothetical protein
MTGQFFLRISRHQNDAETAPDLSGAKGQFMTVDVWELVSS